MCNLAAGFAPLPSAYVTSAGHWICTNNYVHINDPCTWTNVACDPSCGVFALNLQNSGLTGTVSSYIGTLTTLQGLFLYSYSLAGTIPGEIGALTKLQLLEIDNNKFTGIFPFSVCNNIKGGGSNTAPAYAYSMGLTALTLFQADNNNFLCFPPCFFLNNPQNGGFYKMPSSNSIFIDFSSYNCGSMSPTLYWISIVLHKTCITKITHCTIYCSALSLVPPHFHECPVYTQPIRVSRPHGETHTANLHPEHAVAVQVPGRHLLAGRRHQRQHDRHL